MAMCNIACEGAQFSTGFLGSIEIFKGCCNECTVYTVCIWSHNPRENIASGYILFFCRKLSGSSQMAMLHLTCNILTTQVALIPMQTGSGSIQELCNVLAHCRPIHFHILVQEALENEKSSTCLNQDRTLHTNGTARVLQVSKTLDLFFQK